MITYSRSDIQQSGSNTSDDDEPSFKDFSFGALAKAQESLVQKPRKRKLDELEPTSTQQRKSQTPSTDRKTEDHRNLKSSGGQVSARTSKHAPAVQSSRHPVSRRREIFEPSPSIKSRDPRFDPTIIAASNDHTATDRANKKYSFLIAYQQSEVHDLKSQIKHSKDPDLTAQLKRQLMSLESKMRAAEAKHREREILRRHKQKEREAIRSGQKSKPYFLKRGDVRQAAKAEKLSEMGKKARDKAELRRRKREKAKEARTMPRIRKERRMDIG